MRNYGKSNAMSVSIVVITYKRTKELIECLDSILLQTMKPREIILVDNNKDDETQRSLKKWKQESVKQKLTLKYVKNLRGNNVSMARNIGIETAVGDVVFFVDDDAVLDKNFLKEILQVYKEYPAALIVQGYIEPVKMRKISRKILNLLCRFFFLGYYAKDRFEMQPSLNWVFPYPLTRVINCQYASTVGVACKKELFKDFKFDEKLKFAWLEDFDFSHRVFKKYPNAIYATPFAKLTHKSSPKGRIYRRKLIRMAEACDLYTFYKVFEQNPKNKLIYFWSRVGRIFFNLRSFFKLSFSGLVDTIYLIEAYVLCFLHKKEIKNGNLDFMYESFKN